MQLLKCSILIGRTRLDERKFVFLGKNKNCFRRVDINQKNLCFRDFGFLATWINTSYFVLCTNRFSLIFFLYIFLFFVNVFLLIGALILSTRLSLLFYLLNN